jgi:UDP-glucose 4-epimerase
LVAANDAIRSALGWTPRFDRIETIVGDALRWERKLQETGI